MTGCDSPETTTIDDINPALPIIRNILYLYSHVKGR